MSVEKPRAKFGKRTKYWAGECANQNSLAFASGPVVALVAGDAVRAGCHCSIGGFPGGLAGTFPAAGRDDLFSLAARMVHCLAAAGRLEPAVSFDALEKVQN